MTVKASTVRFDPAIKRQLTKLSKLLGVSVNRLTNEAVRDYVLKRTAGAEQELEEMLSDLREYRKVDPELKIANDEFVVAEASITDSEDPAQGEVYMERELESGPEPVKRTVRAMLDG